MLSSLLEQTRLLGGRERPISDRRVSHLIQAALRQPVAYLRMPRESEETVSFGLLRWRFRTVATTLENRRSTGRFTKYSCYGSTTILLCWIPAENVPLRLRCLKVSATIPIPLSHVLSQHSFTVFCLQAYLFPYLHFWPDTIPFQFALGLVPSAFFRNTHQKIPL